MFRALGMVLFVGFAGACAPPEFVFDELPEAVRDGLRTEARLAARYGVAEGLRLAHLSVAEEAWSSRREETQRATGEVGAAGASGASEPVLEAPVARRDSSSPRRGSAGAQRVRSVDINSASRRRLEGVPGVGPALASRIIEGRPYAQVDDLLRVSGIGERTLERMRPWFVVGEE